MVEEAQRSDDGFETGGILLGHLVDDVFVVSCAGGPGPKAIREPHFFLRDLAVARDLASAAWSANGAQWIGDWHTHPTHSLMPSPTDLRSYRTHLREEELQFSAFLAILLRVTGARVNVAAWSVGHSTCERLVVERPDTEHEPPC
ncbi:Mov34/MPN/PAD-1 family protein [Plantibacter sp. YIM 135249]|uniref:Mov34/MPN/PAD-1 family protein n=1 Tax=Plantibacter sp. YIM 135249 TaxID=3423918 RepID=UPI003D34A38C